MEIRELKEALTLIGDAHEREAQDAGRQFERKMLLVADKDTSYFLIVSVLHTASLAKFLKYQLVVVSTTGE
jgi:biopolymer transport protein ExbD